jgi:cob(I)alamin adenosyltransferase
MRTDEEQNAKSAKRKAVQDRIVASKTIEKGLIIVHTGAGTGKSTAAFGWSGMGARSASCSSSRAR